MAQRQFNMENAIDVQALFNILPDFVVRIEKADGYERLLNSRGVYDSTIFFRILWGNKTFVDRPVDKSKWIGCLCWFWDISQRDKRIGKLAYIRKEDEYPYTTSTTVAYKNCRPVKRSEIKFVEDGE